MVAAAPTEGALKPAVAVALLASFVAVLALCSWLTKYTAVYRLTPLDEPPEALRARARDVIKKLGYTEQPLDTADGVVLKEDYLQYIAAHDQSPARWTKLRTEGPGAYRFWYRQSPRYFETVEEIAVDRPALDVSGMTSVYLDMQGRLHWFIGVPPQREPPPTATPTSSAGPTGSAGWGSGRTPTSRKRPPRRAATARRGSACAGPSTCSARASGSRSCAARSSSRTSRRG